MLGWCSFIQVSGIVVFSASISRVDLGTDNCYYRAGPPLLSLLLLAHVGPARPSSLIVRGRRATVKYKSLADIGAGCLYSPSRREEFFSETEMSGNPPASNIQSIVLRRKRRNVILQPFAIVSRRERGKKKG